MENLHGFRIEFEEIARKLCEINGIIEAIVTVKEKVGEKYLCGYIASNEEMSIEDIKVELGKSLPKYMIPKYLLVLPELPKNRNGKIDKRALPEPEIVNVRNYVEPETKEENCVCAVFTEILGITRVGTEDSFFELGGDSIKAIRIVSRIRENGYDVSVKEIMEGQTVKAIASSLRKTELRTEQGEVSGEVPLTPIQHMFFDTKMAEPYHFNQSFLLESNQFIEEKHIEEALKAIVEHHDILRAVYRGKIQTILSVKESKMYGLHIYDLSSVGFDRLQEKMYEISYTVQASMSLENGPLFQAALYHTKGKDYLLLTAHHLVVDGVSWRILVEDLNTAYRAAKEGKGIRLPAKTTSFKRWSECLIQYQDSYLLRRELPYWSNLESLVGECRLPQKETGDNRVDALGDGYGIIDMAMSKKQTDHLLHQAGKAYNTEINDLFLAALARAVSKVAGKDKAAFLLEGHGREDIGEQVTIDRTVGWFTSAYPVAIEGIGKSIEEDIINTKETLRRVPNHGIGYGVLTNGEKALLSKKNPLDITFNYLGEMDSEEQRGNALQMSSFSNEGDVSEKNHFGTPISINGMVIEGTLRIGIGYDRRSFDEKFMDTLAKQFRKELADVVEHCILQKVERKTASDFGELTWKEEEFEKVQGMFREVGLEIERIYPLTSLQEGMLYHKMMDGGSTGYVVQSCFKAGCIDTDKLKESLALLVAKHGALRTAMVYKEVSEPRQVQLGHRELELTCLDYTKEEKAAKKYEEFKRKDVERGFDLEKDTLLRATVVRMPEGDHLVLCFHHIIMDGWCMSILINDLVRFYSKLKQGASFAESMNQVSCNDSYERYVRKNLDKDKEEALRYWTELVEGYDEPAGIESMGEPEGGNTENGAVSLSLPEKETRELMALGKKLGVTVNTIVEAVWGIVLQRYNHTDDVIFGKVVSGRNAEVKGIEGAIGLFINTIPVRVQCKAETLFSDLVCELQKQALQSGQYDYCALAEIQKQSSLGGELIQSLCAFENYYVQEKEVEKEELDLELEDAREQTNYNLTLGVNLADRLSLDFMYATRKYNAKEVRQILERIQIALLAVIEKPETQIRDISMISDTEYNWIIKEFNQTQTPYPRNSSIVELFEEQVERYPDRIAVCFEDDSLTYRDLKRKADQIAGVLRENGVARDSFVGIRAEKRIEIVSGMLGILTAGGAYLPLNPTDPSERTKFILEDSGCHTILAFEDYYTEYGDRRIVNLSRMIDEVGAPIKNINEPTDLAYLMYTSGTTGEPKGTMIEHRNVVRLVKDTNYIDFENVCILQTGALTFDASTFEIWGALLNGGTVTIADSEVLSSPEEFKNMLKRQETNTLWLTSSLFNQMVSIDPSIFDPLEYLLAGGEKLSEHHVGLLRKHNRTVKFINGYGPTENTTFSLTYTVEEVPELIPIGKPISNTTAYILNGDQLCGIGMSGELCLGGDGVGRGYLNRPEMTKEKYIDDPYNPGGRLYRTGDLVRQRFDGNIDYLGRMDAQVKIH
ncbi:MAG TPA: amino acid adenylation domain-containing protein, partial [Lachnospiraceae bacterium]|nr:amino acid adenylation domain-containing protein [Lachnospiraceae bacterium]